MIAQQQQVEVHPAANIFPMIEGKEFDELVADIRANGIRDDIVMYEGKLLDGRNRLKAMQRLGIDWSLHCCEIDARSDFDPVAFVLSTNLHRRHLTTSQRGMIAARTREYYDEEAGKRKKANGGDKRSRKSEVENLPPPPREKAKARDKAGEAAKVSGKTVDTATKVLKSGNAEVIKAVDEGKMSLNKAKQAIEPPKPKPQKPEAFAAVRSYFDSLSVADRGCIAEFCEVATREVQGDKMLTLMRLVIDWSNK